MPNPVLLNYQIYSSCVTKSRNPQNPSPYCSDNQLATDRTWKAKLPPSNPVGNTNPPPFSPSHQNPHLEITTWNCRGLRSGEPYIRQLADEGNDIVVITEHWLWLFEAERLCQIHPLFTAEIKTDVRLNENSTLQRGCGGVGLMWKKSLDATPISSISRDRICVLRLKMPPPETTEVTILGVYLPCADMGIDCYMVNI